MSKVSSACHNALGRALEQLETAMEQEGVWPKKMPAEQELKNATESAVPFAVDCLAFESWLAFIFIPKMRIQRTLSQLQVIDNIANGDIG